MELSGTGKSPNTTLSFRYNANNEELEELFNACDDDPPTPQCDPPVSSQSENVSPKRSDKTSIIDKYFKSMREKQIEKIEDAKEPESKQLDEAKIQNPPKEVSSSPMKEYLNRLGKRSTSDVDVKEPNETWKIFHDFKFKIAQAVEDMKTRSLEETKEKSVPRENSISDSEENSAVKDSDQQSIGDTDNQVSSLDSSIQNLSEVTQPLTAKVTERELLLPADNKNYSGSSDDTHKNIVHSDSAELSKDYQSDSNMMEVESGVEALEDTLDGFGDVTNVDASQQKEKSVSSLPTPQPITTRNLGLPPSKNNRNMPQTSEISKTYFLNFTMYFLTFFVFINYMLFPKSNLWNGFLLGIWFFYIASVLKNWVLDNFFSDVESHKPPFLHMKRSSVVPSTYTIPSVQEHTPMKKYEGWINHYRYPDYDPFTYHINQTTTAFMKLEGCNLRISYTKTKVAKRALWDEKIENIIFYQHRLYNLTGARVILLPKGLVKRRQWSKKYPICVVLNERESIQVLEKENIEAERKLSEATANKKGKETPEVESTETNTSPEKRRKFVWRRREKSISHSDGETGKEGLRHRLVRKMHRDKKPDNLSTCMETNENQEKADKNIPFEDTLFHDAEMDFTTKSTTSTKDDVEEDLDETELSRLKDFLEDAESETGAEGGAEGEWSLHVRRSADKHSHLYLFARTGRDKHEWYRRLTTAVADAKAASPDISVEDERSASDLADSKDGVEMAVFKITEKETVAFAKTINKNSDSISEAVTISTTANTQRMQVDVESYEKTFWPYLLKIIQTKSPSLTCQCRLLPAEVTWVNTLVARIIYDVMRDPVIIARLQNRIQRKLNTLKLPPFMSPLAVTELSLNGACPLVGCVSAPTWDERGVWLDADVRYEGGAYIAILTQLNLMKLKEKNVTLEDQILTTTKTPTEKESCSNTSGDTTLLDNLKKRKPAIYDSDVEDSAESSSDDESPPVQPVDSNITIPISESVSSTPEGTSSKKKFLKMVDKIATNKYFQQVTDYKYVKRAMEGLSNTDIKLHLEIEGLEGRLAINLPPPPHDRIWIGFRTNPQLVLKARPAVGARTLRFAHITNWIEQKLTKEFEKVLVLPNMEDIIVDLMTPTPVEFE